MTLEIVFSWGTEVLREESSNATYGRGGSLFRAFFSQVYMAEGHYIILHDTSATIEIHHFFFRRCSSIWELNKPLLTDLSKAKTGLGEKQNCSRKVTFSGDFFAVVHG